VMIKCLKLEGSEKWGVSEVKIFGVMCEPSWIYSYEVCMWVTVQYVLLSHCLTAICSMSFAFWYVLINRFLVFNFSFCVCCLVLYVLLLFCVFYVFVLFLPMYIDVHFLFVYNVIDHCHQVETQL
jgi:hypothetical protein